MFFHFLIVLVQLFPDTPTHWISPHTDFLSLLETQTLNLEKIWADQDFPEIKTYFLFLFLLILLFLLSWRHFSIPWPPIWREWSRPAQRQDKRGGKPEYREVEFETWLALQKHGSSSTVAGGSAGSRWSPGWSLATTWFLFLVRNGPDISSQLESRNTRDFHCSWRQREGRGSKWSRPCRRTTWGERRRAWSYPSQYTHTCRTKLFRKTGNGEGCQYYQNW